MKKNMFGCVVVFSFVFCWALDIPPQNNELRKNRSYPYNKISPSDKTLIRYYNHHNFRDRTTLGQLANWSDLIAIGRVIKQDWSQVIIHVETALVGCTNNQPIIIKLWPDDDPLPKRDFYEQEWLKIKNHVPTNNAFIVFSAYTNETQRGYIRPVTWTPNPLQQPDQSEIKTRQDFRWWHEDRSWWYTGRDGGLMLEQYTNVVQNLRIERNWTNYVHLCRDGMLRDSIRIKEDSYYGSVEKVG